MQVRKLAAVVAIVMLVPTPSATAAVTVNGDAAGWQEILNAQARLVQAKTYRARVSAPGSGTLVMEVVLPDRIRMVFGTPPDTNEFIIVGNRSAGRVGQGRWRCNPPGPRPATAPDPRDADGEVTVTRIGEPTLDGVRTRGYKVLMVVRGQASRTNQYIAVDTGLPKRLESLTSSDAVEATMDYYDIGAPITIELPPCT